MEGIFLRMVLSATRPSRARGNLGLFSAQLAWIPAFAGMTDGAFSVLQVIPQHVFWWCDRIF